MRGDRLLRLNHKIALHEKLTTSLSCYYMKYIFKQGITLGLLAAILFALNFVFAFTEPSSSPPLGNVPAPLNVGSSGQSKSGGLILNTGGASYGLIVDQGSVGIGTQSPTQKLDVIGYVRGATGLCIGSDCRTGWPTYTPPAPSCDPGQTKIYNLCMDSDLRGPSLTPDALLDCIQRGGHVARLDEYYAACKVQGVSFTVPPFLTGDQSYVHVDVWPAYSHTTGYGGSDQCRFYAATAQSYLNPDSGHAGTWKYKCSYELK